FTFSLYFLAYMYDVFELVEYRLSKLYLNEIQLSCVLLIVLVFISLDANSFLKTNNLTLGPISCVPLSKFTLQFKTTIKNQYPRLLDVFICICTISKVYTAILPIFIEDFTNNLEIALGFIKNNNIKTTLEYGFFFLFHYSKKLKTPRFLAYLITNESTYSSENHLSGFDHIIPKLWDVILNGD
ncbi:hypothetical protein ACJX0J_020403, partial [Zea mays]